MGLTKKSSFFRDRRARAYASSPRTKSPRNEFSPGPSISTQESDELESVSDGTKLHSVPSDDDLLKRARDAHTNADFASLAAEIEANGEWKRVESSGSFIVLQRRATNNDNDKERNGLEVMCSGRIDASLEEIASILRSSSEAEHNTVMSGLYAKSFIFGSYEREVACSEDHQDQDDDDLLDHDEQLAVKTKSFSRTTILGHNEQWCYLDYFQRKKEHDGFTISKRALSPLEPTPGRILENARVDQLHGLNASYLVDKILDEKGGLRVVFHAWFAMSEEDMKEYYASQRKNSRRKSHESKNARRKSAESTKSETTANPTPKRANSFDFGDSTKHKAQLRRLLAMAHGVMKLPDLVRRRRFGVQAPADLNTVHVSNTRCPCCTHSLGPAKLSLGIFKSNTKRCYLCGYLVCVDCWSAEQMECTGSRVAEIVVCTRCHANVQACEYSEVFAGTTAQREKHTGPPRVVEDAKDAPTVSLLVDFLSASLLNTSAGSSDHAVVMAVIRTLLRENNENSKDTAEESEDSENDSEDESVHDYSEEDNSEFDREKPTFKALGETEAVEQIGKLLGDEQLFPLQDCKLGNAGMRDYVIDLPNDPNGIPRSPTPRNEVARIATAKACGIYQLAYRLAPDDREAEQLGIKPDIQDLELLCRLAVKTLGCAYSFMTVMTEKYEHVLAGTNPDFAGAAVPREQTTCQHALMSPHPFMVAHHEADVRFHNHGAVAHLNIRFYVGFPVKVPTVHTQSGESEMTVGMLCCVDSKARNEITRTQYATMTRLASTAKSFLLQKSDQLRKSQAQLLEQAASTSA
ncbi:hypothetical protein PHMEG_0004003 [Phytophthora megakarya]|uniref:GAF domain-containing protein n=1 Tax=Phytophthora megakarya TaxID=4795 RepID=A0A225WUX0_9STRA|nr:hypothetical protein PHMEG_0004003 [Phytophthora megakarya]